MVDEGFNPYHKWLGIPPEEMPPHHYQLLGLESFEADDDVIENAADSRHSYLRSMRQGDQAELAERLAAEVDEAAQCLLTPKRKADYDRQLGAARPDLSARQTGPQIATPPPMPGVAPPPLQAPPPQPPSPSQVNQPPPVGGPPMSRPPVGQSSVARPTYWTPVNLSAAGPIPPSAVRPFVPQTVQSTPPLTVQPTVPQTVHPAVPRTDSAPAVPVDTTSIPPEPPRPPDRVIPSVTTYTKVRRRRSMAGRWVAMIFVVTITVMIGGILWLIFH